MIRVQLGTPPPELTQKGSEELAKAREHFGNPANKGKQFAFKVYKLPVVKDALNEAFHFKCAYCESYFGATQPLDVEHFRPKSAVLIDGKLKWGLYHWLAMSWGNLLPSCTDCNRGRRQRLPDGTTITLGKANQFPIGPETKRAKREGDEKNEPRLLVHPSLDRPEAHLDFDATDGMVTAKTRKGRESTRVYALLRDGLVRARKAMQVEIRTHITVARGLARRLERDGPDPELEAMLVEEITALKRYVEPSHPYSGMARRMVDPVLKELLP